MKLFAIEIYLFFMSCHLLMRYLQFCKSVWVNGRQFCVETIRLAYRVNKTLLAISIAHKLSNVLFSFMANCRAIDFLLSIFFDLCAECDTVSFESFTSNNWKESDLKATICTEWKSAFTYINRLHQKLKQISMMKQECKWKPVEHLIE